MLIVGVWLDRIMTGHTPTLFMDMYACLWFFQFRLIWRPRVARPQQTKVLLLLKVVPLSCLAASELLTAGAAIIVPAGLWKAAHLRPLVCRNR
jgi:hypothetical protein